MKYTNLEEMILRKLTNIVTKSGTDPAILAAAVSTMSTVEQSRSLRVATDIREARSREEEGR